jgi:hypothetical protein
VTVNNTAVADLGVSSDNRVRMNLAIDAELRSWSNDRSGMNDSGHAL